MVEQFLLEFEVVFKFPLPSFARNRKKEHVMYSKTNKISLAKSVRRESRKKLLLNIIMAVTKLGIFKKAEMSSLKVKLQISNNLLMIF
jgi:hypothetical protein